VTFSREKVTFTILKVTFSDEKMTFTILKVVFSDEKVVFSQQFSREFNRTQMGRFSLCTLSSTTQKEPSQLCSFSAESFVLSFFLPISDFVLDTFVRENPNKIWFSAHLIVPLRPRKE